MHDPSTRNHPLNVSRFEPIHERVSDVVGCERKWCVQSRGTCEVFVPHPSLNHVRERNCHTALAHRPNENKTRRTLTSMRMIRCASTIRPALLISHTTTLSLSKRTKHDQASKTELYAYISNESSNTQSNLQRFLSLAPPPIERRTNMPTPSDCSICSKAVSGAGRCSRGGESETYSFHDVGHFSGS